MNFHFLYKSESDPQNFMPNGDGDAFPGELYNYDGQNVPMTGDLYAQLLINKLNALLSNPEDSNQPFNNPYPAVPTKLQVMNVGVFYHESAAYYGFCPGMTCSGTALLYNNFSVDADNTIQCFYINPEDGAIGSNCGWGGVGCNSLGAVTIKKEWRGNYLQTVTSMMADGVSYQDAVNWRIHVGAVLLYHELGHALSLGHVQCNGSDPQCPDTPTPGQLNALYNQIYGGSCLSTLPSPASDPDCCEIGGSGTCCSNNVMNYMGGYAITPCQLAKVHHNIMTSKFDYLEKDFCTSQNEHVVISGSTSIVWNNTRLMRGDIVVQPGSTLTIRCRVFMPQDSRIVVHPGGQLIIDGGEITSACENLWAGIEVWGDAQSSQSPLSNQGFLELRNDAVIENARCAVRVGHLASESPWTYDWTKTGGVVRAVNGHFLNNRKDVEFLSYLHLNSANDEIANRSYFTNCDFVVDRLLNDQGSSIDDRVSLYKVNGVRFTSCTFSIEEEALAAYDLNTRSSGIRGKESGFVVNGKCNYTPPVGGECAPSDITAQTISESSGEVTPSVFRNLHYGIRANGPGSAASVQVSYSLFESNFRGVFLLAMSEPSLFRNRFIISDLNWQDDTEYGAMLSACTGYEVKRNYFEGHTNIAGHRHVGLWISNSGGEPNEVYLNDFKDLHAGTIVMGRNRNSGNSFIGLEVLCDLHDNTLFDIALVQGKSNGGALAQMQGQPAFDDLDFTAPAGNIFNNMNYNNAENDYHIDQWSQPIIYQHHNASSSFNVIPWESDVNDVFKVPNLPQLNDRLQGCPKVPRLSPGVEKQRVLTHREEAEGISEDLHVLIDGGVTELLLQSVNDPFIESPALRNQLISASPFLSDSVLKAAIARSPTMNQWHLCEVLLANSPLQLDVFSYYETAAPLATYLHNLLVAYQVDELSARDQLSAELKEELRLKQHALGNYVRILLESDSLQERSEINTLLDQENDRAAIRRKFAYLRSSGQYQQAQQTLDSYEEQPQDEVWKEVMDILLTIDAVGGYHAADSSHVALLLPLEASDKYGSAHASAVIENITGVDYEEALFYPSLSTKRLNAPVRNKAYRPSLAGVYPNPANGEFFITYVLPADRRDARVRVFDLQGSLILEEDITNGYGILPLNASHMSNGTYLMQLSLNGEVVATEKFIILK